MRWRALTAAGALLVAGLAGCDGDEAPSPPPLEPSTASPSPTEPTGSPAPTRPPEASGTSDESVKAFASYFVSTINHALVTGDTTALDDASGAGCRACRQIAETVNDLYGRGGHIKSSGWKVQGVYPIEDDTDREIVMIGIRFPREVVVQHGQDDIRRKASRGSLTLFLAKSPAGWITNRMDLTQ